VKALFIYWTGTGNTRYITNLLIDQFRQDFEIDVKEINIDSPRQIDLFPYSHIFICYPIYGFNVMRFFSKYIRRQIYHKGTKIIICKNSGETWSANDTSSLPLIRSLKRKGCEILNEYHFVMPYNIHFRYPDDIVNEMLMMDEKLAKIVHCEVMNNIKITSNFRLIPRIIRFFVSIIHIGGDVNSYLYKVDKNKCTKCGLCVQTCPMKNIYLSKKNTIKFHHHCEMCMRCSFNCPKDAISIGFINGWKVNGRYDFDRIKKMNVSYPVVTKSSNKHFHCLIEKYSRINQRFDELFH